MFGLALGGGLLGREYSLAEGLSGCPNFDEQIQEI